MNGPGVRSVCVRLGLAEESVSQQDWQEERMKCQSPIGSYVGKTSDSQYMAKHLFIRCSAEEVPMQASPTWRDYSGAEQLVVVGDKQNSKESNL